VIVGYKSNESKSISRNGIKVFILLKLYDAFLGVEYFSAKKI